MSHLPMHLRRLDRFMNQQGVYPVFLSSLLALLLLGLRMYLSHSSVFLYMAWNLFLAWVPLVASLWAEGLHQHHPRDWWLLLLPGGLWLLFYPNAPYVLTDFWHLEQRPRIPIWYDIGMLSFFGLTGLFLAVVSLRIMQRLIEAHLGRLISWIFVLVVLTLSGLGIYLGRFLRWNSWDLIVHPRAVLSDIVVRVAHPLSHPTTYAVTLLFASILLVCYLMFTSRQKD